jgi:hypothetical protein
MLFFLFPVVQALNSPFLKPGQPSRAPLRISLKIVMIVALVLNLTVEGSLIWYQIVGLVL